MEDSVVALISAITDECNAKNIEASPALIAYTVRSLISSRNDEFQIDSSKSIEPEKLSVLHKETMELLNDQDSIPMKTIRMQVDMDTGLAQVERRQKQKEEREQEHLSAIEQELITTRVRSTAALDSLYRKIVSYTIISSKWGSPNDPQCVRQSTAALEQVFPEKEISKFINKSPEEKRKKLQELSKLVLGVRVFQAFGGDITSPTPNLRVEVPKKLQELQTRIQTSIDSIHSIIYNYNRILTESKPKDEKRLSEELSNRQQFLYFYDLILSRLNDTISKTEQSCNEYDQLLNNLRSFVNLNDSTLTPKSFPLFISLSNTWITFNNNELILKDYEFLLSRLRKHRDTFQLSISEKESILIQRNENITNEKTKNNNIILPKENEINVSNDDSTPIIIQCDSNKEFEFNGFCPMTIIERDGLLLPGDIFIGCVKWERKYFLFVDKNKQKEFMENPESLYKEAINVIRQHPELISLLGLQNLFPNLNAPVIPLRNKTPLKIDSKYRNTGVNTSTHPTENYSFIDKTYHWNQWELMNRKKIVKRLQNKRTKSAQTDISHYRRDNEVQTVEKRDKNEQTMVDSGVEMPRTVRYIAGLRGDTQTRAKIVTLTFP
ncbi:cilia- and flagella-associated protein [Histomonas meleagridis]|uniref:cilia- and flagella-associated protein n=1 Tax=Histomonas meleagridis TaxID=135588 RepID=UPI00355A1C37|nr:cilia- and flagella-associated protein [Histomonas meleagridis]KAH0804514.1 cilia- and flagella-associated protein [Histomonas meleagridis]